MWLPKGNQEKKGTGNGLVAVAIDKDKGSQHALKWAAENLLSKGKTVILIHVVQLQSSSASHIHHSHALSINGTTSPQRQHLETLTKDLFLTFHCYCTRKDIQCLDVVLEDTEVAKALTEYVSYAAIENLVLGSSSKHGFIRFKTSSIPSGVTKGAPDFCTVYIISKGKISSVRNASRPAPFTSPLITQIQNLSKQATDPPVKHSKPNLRERTSMKPMTSMKPITMQEDSIRSPLAFGTRHSAGSLTNDMLELESDISFVSSGRPSPDRSSSFLYDAVDLAHMPRMSVGSEGHGSIRSGPRFSDHSSLHDFSSVSQDSGRTSCSSQNMDEVEMEMRRLRLELKQTMELYSNACKEALTAKQKALELHHWRREEERRLEEARVAEEAAVSTAEKEKARCRAAVEEAEAAQRIAELEARKRLSAEMTALKETDDMKKEIDKVHIDDVIPTRYRRYSIEEIEAATNFFSASLKIGEGGYGPVYKCYLDYTPVAVKVLRPDAAQGRSQFNQEVEVLSCIRHPNMVLLLGACPEYGCLVYEYMANGSLEDRLLRRGNSRALSWQVRFRIAAEIATGLMFLHQTKPEPIVHRDLKPGNILLDHYYVSKISDVGLARLVPPSVAETVTQYRMTSTAGTFCYIDPEYQQTGMLGVKSDVYSLGIMLLQLITAKPPMGITHLVGRSIEEGNFSQVLDPEVPDWPVEEALSLAKIALQCSELRRKDRPDLGKVVLPELSRLRNFAEDNNMHHILVGGGGGGVSLGPSPNSSQASISITQEVMSDPQLAHIHSESSSKSQSNASVATIS